jgi:hypothetical protein
MFICGKSEQSLDSAFYASKFLILEVFLHEKRKPEFRIGHLRLASNRNVTLRSAELPQRCANSSSIGQAITRARS